MLHNPFNRMRKLLFINMLKDLDKNLSTESIQRLIWPLYGFYLDQIHLELLWHKNDVFSITENDRIHDSFDEQDLYDI
jgi:hypothetical protein